MDGARLEAECVESDCEEADGDVEDLAGDFVAVDLNVLVGLSTSMLHVTATHK
jgi:hypothetical protein